MLIRKLIFATCVAASLASVSTLANARTDVGVYLNFGPPPVYYERAPAFRVGYVWIPGFWDWRYSRHHWVPGHYARHRPGYVYHQTRWTHHDGRWRHDRGYWGRDYGHHYAGRDYNRHYR